MSSHHPNTGLQVTVPEGMGPGAVLNVEVPEVTAAPMEMQAPAPEEAPPPVGRAWDDEVEVSESRAVPPWMIVAILVILLAIVLPSVLCRGGRCGRRG